MIPNRGESPFGVCLIGYEVKGAKMGLIIKEIMHTINECEENKKHLIRDCERKNEEIKAYEHIKNLMGVIANEENNNTVR